MAYTGELASLEKDYANKGAREAKKHSPPTDSIQPDHNENSLRLKGGALVNQEHKIFDKEVNEANRVASNIAQKIEDYRTNAQALISDDSLQSSVEILFAKNKSALAVVVQKRIETEVDYKAFRYENEITSQADYPSSHVMHLAIIVICFLFEALANSIFFEGANGFLLAFPIASLISLLNIVAAAILGFGWRYKNVADKKFKVAGWTCLGIYIILTLFLNALFSSYRSAFELLVNPNAIPEQMRAFKESFESVAALQIQIQDMNSFMLFAFGLILSGIAFWKGYSFDDKYPGHGRLHRILSEAENAEREELSQLRERIVSLLDQYRSKISLLLNEPTKLSGEATAKFSSLKTAIVNLKSHIKSIERDYKHVLGAYRSTNTAIRASAPPQYFQVIVPLSNGVVGEDAEPILIELQNIQSEISDVKVGYQNPLNQKLEEVKARSGVILKDEINIYHKNIVQTAKDKINADIQTIHRVK